MARFAELATEAPEPEPTEQHDPELYPGSKQKRRAVAGPRDPWDDIKPFTSGKKLPTVKGVPTKLYSIAVLAEMLDRKPPAIRKWERLGYIPETRWRSPGRTQNGQRRLYSREQIEGIVKIAQEEGLIGESNRNVSATAFPERVRKLFKELKQ